MGLSMSRTGTSTAIDNQQPLKAYSSLPPENRSDMDPVPSDSSIAGRLGIQGDLVGMQLVAEDHRIKGSLYLNLYKRCEQETGSGGGSAYYQ